MKDYDPKLFEVHKDILDILESFKEIAYILNRNKDREGLISLRNNLEKIERLEGIGDTISG